MRCKNCGADVQLFCKCEYCGSIADSSDKEPKKDVKGYIIRGGVGSKVICVLHK